VLDKYAPNDVQVVVSHNFCSIVLKAVLNSGVRHINLLVEVGLLKKIEAEHFIEKIEEHLKVVHSCELCDHPGEIAIDCPECEFITEDKEEITDRPWNSNYNPLFRENK
jgi:hypothetical protein